MKPYKILISIVIVFIVLVALLIHREGKVPEHNDKLSTKRNCAFNNVDLFEITNLLSNYAEVPVGIEAGFSFEENQNGKSHRFSLNVSSMPIRDILDEIIRLNPGYFWRENNGIVNIQPIRKNDNKHVSPLDMTIPNFEVHRMPPYSAFEYLRRQARKHDIPITTAFYEMAERNGQTLPDPEKIEHPENYDPKQLIDVVILNEVSIRECMNAMVLADQPAYWAAIKWTDNKVFLYMSSPQPDYSREKDDAMAGSHELPSWGSEVSTSTDKR